MIVKVTWRNKNPFCPLEKMGRVSEGELTDDTPLEIVEKFAKEATPEGYFLFQIKMPNITYRYSYTTGERRVFEGKVVE